MGRFQIIRVLHHLKEEVICERWEEFGCCLGLSDVEIEKVKEKLTLTPMEILRELLRIWRNGHGDNANLRVLCDALLDMNLSDVADCVRDAFNCTTEPLVPPASVLNGLGLKRRNNEIEISEIASSSSSKENENAVAAAAPVVNETRVKLEMSFSSKRLKSSTSEAVTPTPVLIKTENESSINADQDQHGLSRTSTISEGKGVAFIEVTSTANGFKDRTSVSNTQDDSVQPLEQNQKSNSLFPVILPEKPSFMITFFRKEAKDLMEKCIKDLGGRVSAPEFFDKDCDAMISGALVLSEKILTCIASGKLLLKSDYIKQSQEAGRFLPIDEKFLWHEDDANNDGGKYLARASFSFCIAQMRDKSRKCMTGMRFFVTEPVENKKKAALLRIILAGGGVIVNSMEEATMIIKDGKCSVQTPPGTEVTTLQHLILKPPNH